MDDFGEVFLFIILQGILSGSGILQFGTFLSVAFSESRCISVWEPSSSPSNSFSYYLSIRLFYWVLSVPIYEVPSINFQTVFVQTFKIVTILFLYILWDDWPIFMISASNEQLQQELEYTLLKPDCYTWWISKLQSTREDTLEERYAIKFCFKLGKNATEMYGILQTAFRPSCTNRASVLEWHKTFKEGTESVRDDDRCGRSKEVNTPELIRQRARVRVTMLRF